jgi:four helix bundle protein
MAEKRDVWASVQARTAAFSVSLNIAEGASKRGPREMRRYLDIALGSLSELQFILRFAKDLKLANDEEINRAGEAAQRSRQAHLETLRGNSKSC